MSQIHFIWCNTLHVSDGLSVRHQQFKTVHAATGICQTHTAVWLLAGITLYMFRTVFPSVIRSSRLCIQQQSYAKQILPTTCLREWDSWWWTGRPSETCRVLLQ